MNNDQSDDLLEIHKRGERLKRIRHLANLSRKELCQGSNININTYIGYEVGRYGGLTKKSAEKIIRYLATKGVYSTYEWLMYEIGSTPSVITDFQNVFSSKDNYVDQKSEQELIVEELCLFRHHYTQAINFRITDDGMSPGYKVGDYVAGIKLYDSKIDNIIGSTCIVKTGQNEIFVRTLRAGRKKNFYILTCSNPQTTVEHPVMYDVELLLAAKIIWHRQLFVPSV